MKPILILTTAALLCLVALPAEAQPSGPSCSWHECGEHGGHSYGSGQCPEHMECLTTLDGGQNCISCWKVGSETKCITVDPGTEAENGDDWGAIADCLGSSDLVVLQDPNPNYLITHASGGIGQVAVYSGLGNSSKTTVNCAGQCSGPLCGDLDWSVF